MEDHNQQNIQTEVGREVKSGNGVSGLGKAEGPGATQGDGKYQGQASVWVER